MAYNHHSRSDGVDTLKGYGEHLLLADKVDTGSVPFKGSFTFKSRQHILDSRGKHCLHRYQK